MTLSLIREHNSNYQRWESPPRTEVNPGFSVRCKPQKLGRIREMPLPQLGNCRWCDQVHGLLPLDEKLS